MRIRNLLIMILLVSATKLFANYPVFDKLGWLAAIDRFYQGYDQVMNTITMIEQNYKQIQDAYERAKSWSFEELDFNDGDILHSIDIRDEIKDAGNQINRQLNNIRKIRDTFNAKNIVMNGHTYSMKDLAGIGDADRSLVDLVSDAYYVNQDSMLSAAQAFASGVSDKDAEKIYSKYGLSPKNFHMVKTIDKMVQKATLAVLAPAEEILEGAFTAEEKEKTALMNAMIDKIISKEGGELTTNQLLQMQAMLQRESINDMREMVRSFRSASAYTAWQNRYLAVKDEAKQKESEDLLLMMKEDGKRILEWF